MSAIAAPRVAPATTAFEPRLIRTVAFLALGLFAGLHWAGLVVPGAGGALFLMLLVSAGAGLRLAVVAGYPTRWRRIGERTLLAVGFLLLLLWSAKAPPHALRPDHWDELVTGVGNGLAALPGLRIPYRGVDEWTRAVIISGGGLLLGAAAWLALSVRHPRPLSAAICLGVLYAVPIVERNPASPWLDGAVFALLLAAFLWGERLSGAEAPLAVSLVGVAVLAALILAPRLDAGRPWIDYEKLAESLQAGKTTTFSWNHSYAPLTWPRDGREMLRIRARAPTYWKAEALEEFDGTAWRQSAAVGPGGADSEGIDTHPGWIQRLDVTVRGLKSTAFVAAGTTLRVDQSSRLVGPATPGTFRTLVKPLRRGDGYTALSYVPRPSVPEMGRAGTAYPPFVARELTMDLPARPPRAGATDLGKITVSFPSFGSDSIPVARVQSGFFGVDGETVLAQSSYARMYELARTLAGGSRNPYDFARRVQARVRRDATYTERPPDPGRLQPLDAFLFRDHAGYCQHFSGAMALLLRMGGVPARVATGFSPGSRDGGDFVARDIDAHSWVEVYFPRLGWVTFDPTPADSPARSQIADLERPSPAPGNRPRGPALGDRTSDPTAGGAAPTASQDSSGPWAAIGIAAVALGLLVAALVALLRRRGVLGSISALDELRRALARSGRSPTADLTLHRIEATLLGSPEATAYLRALRLARYAGRDEQPTPAQRRALRRELGAGLGLRGRLRALWALPPRPREVLTGLKARRPRPYTE